MYGGTLLSESQSRDAHQSRLVMGCRIARVDERVRHTHTVVGLGVEHTKDARTFGTLLDGTLLLF